MLAGAGFSAIAPDWIGHGSSDKPASGPAFDYSAEAYIKELEGFVSTHGMTEPFALVVHVSVKWTVLTEIFVETLLPYCGQRLMQAMLHTEHSIAWTFFLYATG